MLMAHEWDTIKKQEQNLNSILKIKKKQFFWTIICQVCIRLLIFVKHLFVKDKVMYKQNVYLVRYNTNIIKNDRHLKDIHHFGKDYTKTAHLQ